MGSWVHSRARRYGEVVGGTQRSTSRVPGTLRHRLLCHAPPPVALLPHPALLLPLALLPPVALGALVLALPPLPSMDRDVQERAMMSILGSQILPSLTQTQAPSIVNSAHQRLSRDGLSEYDRQVCVEERLPY